jgi:hypothetical protein
MIASGQDLCYFQIGRRATPIIPTFFFSHPPGGFRKRASIHLRQVAQGSIGRIGGRTGGSQNGSSRRPGYVMEHYTAWEIFITVLLVAIILWTGAFARFFRAVGRLLSGSSRAGGRDGGGESTDEAA